MNYIKRNIGLLYLVLFSLVSANLSAQCNNGFGEGGNPDPNSGWQSVSIGSGTYTDFINIQNGAIYSFRTCNSVPAWGDDTELTGRTTTGTQKFYNQNDGPWCQSVRSSADWVADFSGTLRVHTNRYACNGWQGSGTGNSVILEYRECIPPADPGYGSYSWNVFCYVGTDRYLGGGTKFFGYYNDGNLDIVSTNRWPSLGSPSDASGWVGCPAPNDRHTVVYKRQGFDCGFYQIDVNAHDDDVILYVNGAPVWDQTGCCADRGIIWSGYLGSGSTVEFRVQEGGGGSELNVDFIDAAKLSASVVNTINPTCSGADDGCIKLGAGGTYTGPLQIRVRNTSSNIVTVPIKISNTNGSTLTNYQVRFRVNYKTGMRTDFGDLRFFDESGITGLDYWVEEQVNSSYAIVWVEVPSIPASGGAIRMTYGNSSLTSASNGANTFLMFEDFGVSNNYSWSAVGTSGSVTSGYYQLAGSGSCRSWAVPTNGPVLSNGIYEMKYQIGGGDAEAGYFPRLSGTGSPTNGYQVFLRGRGTNDTPTWRMDNGDTGCNGIPYIGTVNTGWTVPLNTWMYGKLKMNGASFQYFPHQYTYPGTSYSFSDGTYGSGRMGFGHYAYSDIRVDWLFVRTFATNEPVATVGGNDNMSVCGLVAGSYEITLEDANGCTATTTATLNNVTSPGTSAVVITERCNYSNDGLINLTATNGTPNRVFSLDGSGDYLDLPDDEYFDGGNFTIEAWVYPRAYTNWSRIMDFGNGANSDNILFALSQGTGGYPTFSIRRGSTENAVPSSQQLPLNTWTHVAVVYNSGTCTMYFNGTQVGNNTSMHSPNNLVRTGNFIGRSNWGPGADPDANMSIDEFRIWNTNVSLTNLNAYRCAADISTHPNYKNLKVYLPFNEGAGNPLERMNGAHPVVAGNPVWVSGSGAAYDCYRSTGYRYQWSNASTNEDISSLASGSYTVTVTDAFGCSTTRTETIGEPTALTPGTAVTNESCNYSNNGAVNLSVSGATPNYAFSLDGSGDYLDLPDDVYFTGGSFTIEAWVYPRSHASWSRIMDFGNGPNSNNVLLTLSEGTNGEPVFSIRQGAVETRIDANQQLPLNTWTHVAAVFNGTTGFIYFNGTQVATGAMSAPLNVVRTGNYVGKSNWPDADANMIIDEFRVWTTAVSVGNLNSYRCASNLSSHPNVASLRVHLPFNQSTGVPMERSAGNNPVVGGNPTWVSGSSATYGCFQTTGYSYNWSTGATTEDISSLASATYSVTIYDAAGCTATTSATVTEPAALVATATPTNRSCPTSTDGSVALSVSGGTTAYSYAWSNGATSQNISNLSPGTYSVVVTDANGCTANASATVGTAPAASSTTWTGLQSTDWTDYRNWTNCVPTSATLAIVPTSPAGPNWPVVNNGVTAVCDQLDIAPNAQLTIATGGVLNVNN